MGRPSLQDVRGLTDPLLSYNWNLIIPSIPGGGSSKGLSIRCMNTPLPGMSVDYIPVALHGVVVTYAGMQQWSHQLQVTYLEDRSMATRNTIKGWLETARNTKQNAGTEKATYATNAKLELMDDIPNVIKTVNLVGVYPLDLGDGQLDGGRSDIVPIPVRFAFDYTFDS